MSIISKDVLAASIRERWTCCGHEHKTRYCGLVDPRSGSLCICDEPMEYGRISPMRKMAKKLNEHEKLSARIRELEKENARLRKEVSGKPWSIARFMERIEMLPTDVYTMRIQLVDREGYLHECNVTQVDVNDVLDSVTLGGQEG